MKISVVIPTYNEAKKIVKTVEAIWQFFKKRGNDFEIIVSDDGSKDNTCEVIENLQTKYQNLILLKNSHTGKGITVKTGMEKAVGDVVLFTDADLATPIAEFDKFLKKFKVGSDIVIGSRGIARTGAPVLRWSMAIGLNLLARILLGLNFSDTQCGFKAFRKKSLLAILPKMLIFRRAGQTSYSRVTASFDLELLTIAKKAKFKIAEIPVDWQHKPSTAVRPITESLITLFEIFKIKLNDLKGLYG